MSRALRVALLAGWVGLVIAITTTPWSGITTHGLWKRVTWIPFHDTLRPLDAAANVLLFVPFGVLTGSRPTRAMGAAILLSIAIELAQVFIAGRMATATDVVMNTLGAALGAGITLTARRGRGPAP